MVATPAFAHHYTILLNGLCNQGVITTDGLDKTFLYRETTPQSCNDVIGTGVRVKHTVIGTKGTWLMIGEVNFDYPNEENTLFLQYPLVSGSKYEIFATTNGETLTYLGGGTYLLQGQ